MDADDIAGAVSPRDIFDRISGDRKLVGELAKLAKAYKLREYSRSRLWTWGAAATGFIYGFAPSYGIAVEVLLPGNPFGQILIGVGGGLFLGVVFYLVIKKIWNWQATRTERQVGLYHEAQQLQDTIQEDFVNKLIRINFKYIDIYYEQTREQANKSFLLSAVAALVGLLIIGAGIWMLFTGQGSEKLTAGIVVTATGALSEFIAAVFFYLYNQTVTKMSEYHRKLVITQNVSLALKVIDDLPEEPQVESRKLLIDRLTDGVNKILVGDTN